VTKIIKKQTNKNVEYERLKKRIKNCKSEEYEKAIKEICERLDY